MPNIYGISDVVIHIEAMKSGVLTPDDDGYYNDVPLAVLDYVSRNKTKYTYTSFMNILNDESTTFVQRLKEGSLIGEYGHPDISGLSNQEKIIRITTLDPRYECHTFRNIYVKEINRLKIVFGSLKPSGPYGKYLKEKLEDPTVNVCFSLRALTNDKIDRRTGILIRDFVVLSTFDYVAGGGFKEASKSKALEYKKSVSTEFFKVPIENIGSETIIAMESILTEHDLKKICKFSKIMIKEQVIGSSINDGKILIEGNKVRNPFHIFIRR